ncbi:MAG: hypothetical protein ACRDLF_04570 [Solirubrobacteraceae bacterium]
MTAFRNPPKLELDGPRKCVAVLVAGSAPDPHGAPACNPVLELLERIFPVRFELTPGAPPPSVAGALVLDPARLADVPADSPRLVVAATGQRREPTVVELADDRQLARPLRGRKLADGSIAGELPLALDGARGVLASVDGTPVWWQDGASAWSSVYPLAELGEGETLREHLRAGRFMGLLPLVHFLGHVAGAEGWALPSPRASFVVDDPNLHWPSYGYLKYRELIAHAGRHGYHLGLATVPLDRWWVDRRAAGLVRHNGSALSLLMHGNDHVAQELGRLRSDRKAESVIAQSLRRTAALERRAGVTVNRVMVPPHSACSEEALRAMLALGIEAVCLNRSYPWRDGQPAPTPLVEWHPAELVAGGLPMLLRSPLVDPREDLVFRALLGQPLILYGHHWDFSEGLDILAQAARDINALGDVRWGPLEWVARGGYCTRRVGETMFVRMCARGIAIDVPTGVHELRALAQQPLGGAAWRGLARGGDEVVGMAFDEGLGVSEPLRIEAPGRIELTLVPDRPLNPAVLPAPGRRPWSFVRRAMVEGRDRVQALR